MRVIVVSGARLDLHIYNHSDLLNPYPLTLSTLRTFYRLYSIQFAFKYY
jgi:hypothetical protein